MYILGESSNKGIQRFEAEVRIFFISCFSCHLWTIYHRKACYLSSWWMRYGMMKETLLLFTKYLGNFLTKIQNQKLVSSMMLNFLPKPYISLIKNLPHKLLALCWVLSSLVDPCWEIYHVPKIKITYTPHICAASILEVRKKHVFHLPQNVLLLHREKTKKMLAFIRINALSSW